MVKVPIHTRQVMPQVGQVPTPTFPQPVRAAFGEDVAKAKQGMADVGLKLAALLGQQAIKKQEIKNDKQTFEIASAFRREAQDRMINSGEETVTIRGQKVTRSIGWMNRKLGNAENSILEADSWFKIARERALAQAPTEEHRQKLLESMDGQYSTMRGAIIGNEVKQDRQNTTNSLTAEIDLIIQDASNAQDDISLKNSLDSLLEPVDSLNRHLVLDEDSAILNKRGAVVKLLKSSLNGALLNDITGEKAEALLLSVKDEYLQQDEYDLLLKETKATSKKLIDNLSIDVERQQFISRQDFEKGSARMPITEAIETLDKGIYLGVYDRTWAEKKKKAILYSGGIDQEKMNGFEADIIMGINDAKAGYLAKEKKERGFTDAQQYLRNLKDIELKINDGIAKGYMDKNTAKTHLEKLYGATTAEATNKAIVGRRFHFDIDDANKVFKREFTLDADRHKAVREFFYETDGQKLSGKDKEIIATDIMDRISNRNREEVLTGNDFTFEGSIVNIEEEAKALGYNIKDVRDTARKYNITEQEVINRLKAK